MHVTMAALGRRPRTFANEGDNNRNAFDAVQRALLGHWPGAHADGGGAVRVMRGFHPNVSFFGGFRHMP